MNIRRYFVNTIGVSEHRELQFFQDKSLFQSCRELHCNLQSMIKFTESRFKNSKKKCCRLQACFFFGHTQPSRSLSSPPTTPHPNAIGISCSRLCSALTGSLNRR